MNEPYRYYLICMDDDGDYTFATHGGFYTREEATQYLTSIARTRQPIIVSAWKPIRTDYHTNEFPPYR